MAHVRSWAGLDVHARSVLAVTMDAESGESRRCKLTAETYGPDDALCSGGCSIQITSCQQSH
jgi:hypothetical protein